MWESATALSNLERVSKEASCCCCCSDIVRRKRKSRAGPKNPGGMQGSQNTDISDHDKSQGMSVETALELASSNQQQMLG